MALSLRADIFPSGNSFCMVFVFGKGMALSLRADIFPSGNSSRMVFVFFGKGMALSLRWTYSHPERHPAWCRGAVCNCALKTTPKGPISQSKNKNQEIHPASFCFSERAWPYPYVLTFSRSERHPARCRGAVCNCALKTTPKGPISQSHKIKGPVLRCNTGPVYSKFQ